MIATNIQ